jgi:hypothetical protein
VQASCEATDHTPKVEKVQNSWDVVASKVPGVEANSILTPETAEAATDAAVSSDAKHAAGEANATVTGSASGKSTSTQSASMPVIS